eukprot:10540768-Alexandrium_andersonii.AAC.1
MSASLVGSEMCIRDRLILPRVPSPSYSSSTDASSSPRATRLASRISCRAVSYTHLTLPTICSV